MFATTPSGYVFKMTYFTRDDVGSFLVKCKEAERDDADTLNTYFTVDGNRVTHTTGQRTALYALTIVANETLKLVSGFGRTKSPVIPGPNDEVTIDIVYPKFTHVSSYSTSRDIHSGFMQVFNTMSIWQQSGMNKPAERTLAKVMNRRYKNSNYDLKSKAVNTFAECLFYVNAINIRPHLIHYQDKCWDEMIPTLRSIDTQSTTPISLVLM